MIEWMCKLLLGGKNDASLLFLVLSISLAVSLSVCLPICISGCLMSVCPVCQSVCLVCWSFSSKPASRSFPVQLLKSSDVGRHSLLYLKEIGHGWFGKVIFLLHVFTQSSLASSIVLFND